MSPTYRYPRPMVTVDVVVLAMPGERIEVLLIRRKRAPFKGQWAVPGGFIELDEELEDAGRRELFEETGVQVGAMSAFGTFGALGRDPRGRTISAAFLALCATPSEVSAGDDAAAARWFALDSLPSLAFDHDEVLRRARGSLRERAERETVAFDLLPRQFTMSKLRDVYRQILDRPLEPQRFRRRMLATGVLERTGRHDGSAAIYRLSRRLAKRAGSSLRFAP